MHEHGIDPEAIRSADDFGALPFVSKTGYLQRHPLRDLCRSSTLNDFEICRLLWALMTLGMVVRTSHVG